MSKMKTVLVMDGGFMFKRVDKHIARAAYKNNMALLICPKDKVPSLNYDNTIRISKSKYSSDFDSRDQVMPIILQNALKQLIRNLQTTLQIIASRKRKKFPFRKLRIETKNLKLLLIPKIRNLIQILTLLLPAIMYRIQMAQKSFTPRTPRDSEPFSQKIPSLTIGASSLLKAD